MLAALLRDPRTGSPPVPPDVIVAQRPNGERRRPQPVWPSVGVSLHEHETAVDGPLDSYRDTAQRPHHFARLKELVGGSTGVMP